MDVWTMAPTQRILPNGSGHYRLKLKREAALEKLSKRRVDQLWGQAKDQPIELAPQEPVLELV